MRHADPVPTFRISLDRIPFLASLQQWLIYSKTNGEYEGEDRMKEFKGKVAVITGAAPHGFRNTGLALARSISVITPSGLEIISLLSQNLGQCRQAQPTLLNSRGLTDSFTPARSLVDRI